MLDQASAPHSLLHQRLPPAYAYACSASSAWPAPHLLAAVGAGWKLAAATAVATAVTTAVTPAETAFVFAESAAAANAASVLVSSCLLDCVQAAPLGQACFSAGGCWVDPSGFPQPAYVWSVQHLLHLLQQLQESHLQAATIAAAPTAMEQNCW